MQQLQDEGLQLHLIDTTSVFSKPINNSCHFDGSTLTYLAGAHILLHNVFQNGKQFLERVSDHQVAALAFHHSAELTVLLVTRDPFCHVEFYFYGKKPVVVDIHEDLQVLDAVFLEKKRVCLLTYDRVRQQASLLLVSSHKKVKRVGLAQRCFKLCANQRKVYVLSQLGCYEFNIQSEMFERKKLYEGISIKNILITQTENDIVFDSAGNCYYMQDYKQKQIFSLAGHFGKEKVEYQSSVRVGHNLLVAVRGQFVLLHYSIGENQLQLNNRFEYGEKIKGNIVAMQSSVDEMNLAIALQTTYKDQARIEHFLFNLSALSNEKKFISPFVKLHSGGEAGEVSSLQCVIPSEVYCLTGPHIINYSYVEHIEKKHKYSIHESPKSVAVHPLGHQLLCVFETAFKFYQKVEMELVQIWTQSLVVSCARYTDNGLLVLCIYEDGAHNILVYNPNTFRRLRSFTGLYLKHAVSRIDFDQNSQELILYSQKDLLVHNFKRGERLSEFREKREMTDVGCIEYDSIRKWLLVASKHNIVVCRKTEQYLLNFNSQKVIQIDHEITCINLCQNAQTIFFGTSNGVVLYCPYPLQPFQETIDDVRVFKVHYQSVKVHYQPLSDLMLTNNCKFLFAAIKGDGLSILRAKRLAGTGKGGYSSFDISNYNFIESSSIPYLDNVHEKLKGLLEKRKTIFNELDQFKKEWEGKRIVETKLLTAQNKKKELSYINGALEEINRCKLQHTALLEELSSFETSTEKKQTEAQMAHHCQLLSCYEQNNKKKDKLQEVQLKCKKEWENITGQCTQNLNDIHSQLEAKFKHFESTYLLMKQNLLNYRKRMDLEQQQQEAVREEQIACTKARLKEEEEELYRRNNELKGDITKNRKELERFVNRKDFLQNKRRFFMEELKYCDCEQRELLQVKQALEEELTELQSTTHKKEKRLRKYFLQNQILIKYQLIHDNITKQSNKEIQFIELQHQKLRHNIGELQKQILFVSEEREKHQKELKERSRELEAAKADTLKLKQKRDFLQLQVQQIQDAIATTNTGKIVDQQSKNEDFLAIYQNFFVDKQLQTFLSSREAKTDELAVQENKRSQEGVKAVLQDHKQYLVRNMELFENYNTRVMDEINLTYLKYQTENYDLISECNVRKEQINKKKRILHELVDSIRDTNNYIAAMHHSRPHKQTSPPPPELPFPIYEQAQQQERVELRKDKSQSALWKIKKSSYQVRKMLEVQKLKSGNLQTFEKVTRRIQTANIKKKPQQSSHEQVFAEQSQDVMNPMGFIEDKKPQTAFHRYRKKENNEARRLFSRNKSSSKPTTCTSHTKSKQSLFI